MKEVTVSLTK